MCGIAGEFVFDGSPASPDAVRAMTDALSHRGPDDEGLYCEGPIGLGHRRLAIIDLTPSGHQPMWTPDRRYAVVFNGEIYNHAEIRNDLEAVGWQFLSRSDTEVLLAAVAVWGIEKALVRFIGMFAFALWDSRTQAIILCRDRAGIKPLHYYIDANRLIFASELKGLTAHKAFRRAINPSAVAQFLSMGYIAAPQTVYAQTFKLPAAHFARVPANGIVSVQRYWELPKGNRGTFAGTLDDAAAELDDLATSAFKYRLVSDVPVAVFLSGGTDSAYLAAILKHRVGADLLHLTIGFENQAFDETANACEVARVLGLRHEVHRLEAGDAVEMLHRFVDVYDEPFADTSGIPTLQVSGVARTYVKVALSADGGDEQFCGYESYAEYSRAYRFSRALPGLARDVAAKFASSSGLRAILAKNMAPALARSQRPQVLARIAKAARLLKAESSQDLMKLMYEKAWPSSSVASLLSNPATTASTSLDFVGKDLRGPALIDTMMRLDYEMFLADDVLTKVDRASMAVSLECRDPLLDHRISEFTNSLPLDYLLAGGEHKRLLKHSLRKWLPDQIVKAPKRGFSIPLYQWLWTVWRPIVDDYLSPDRVRRVGLLDPNAVKAAVSEFYGTAGNRAERVMALLLLQMWAERWHR